MALFEKYSPKDNIHGKSNNPDGLLIRLARLEDSAEIAKLKQEREPRPLFQIKQEVKAELENSLKGNERKIFVAEIKNEIVGFARVSYFEPAEGSPSNSCPEGWYLNGIIISPEYRRRGIASELTRKRLAWIAERAYGAYYFANVQNRVSIELHSHFGFHEISRDFTYPGVTFTGGEGLLFRTDLSK